MILSEVQVLSARIIHDPKQFKEVSDRIEEVKDMILSTIQIEADDRDTVYQ